MFNIKPIEIMKKIIIAIIAIISIITLNSCGNNAKECRLIEMRDSIQAQIDWQQEAIISQYNELDSLFKYDRDKYGYMHDYYIDQIDMLQSFIDNEKDQIFQIELQLNSK